MYHFKKNSRECMPPKPTSKAYGFATCKFPNLGSSWPPPAKSWVRPCTINNFCLTFAF